MKISNAYGFSILEILIIIAVIIIMLSIALAGYVSLNLRQTLISGGQNMKNILRDAQSRAYTGEIDCGICNCEVGASTDSAGWYVDFSNKEIYGNCGGNGFPIPHKNFGLSDDIPISPTQNGVPVTNILFRSKPAGVDSAVTICLSLNNLANNFY